MAFDYPFSSTPFSGAQPQVHNIVADGGVVVAGHLITIAEHVSTRFGSFSSDAFSSSFRFALLEEENFGVFGSGLADITAIYNLESADGVLINGSAELSGAAGGLLGDGTTALYAIYNITTSSGLFAAGDSASSQTFTETASGGCFASGDSGSSESCSETASEGGFIAGSTGQYVIWATIEATDGVLANGAPAVFAVYNIVADSGLFAAGDSSNNEYISETATGGCFADGSSSSSEFCFETASEGCFVAGDVAAYIVWPNIDGTAGTLANGDGTSVRICVGESGDGLLADSDVPPYAIYTIFADRGISAGGSAEVQFISSAATGVLIAGQAIVTMTVAPSRPLPPFAPANNYLAGTGAVFGVGFGDTRRKKKRKRIYIDFTFNGHTQSFDGASAKDISLQLCGLESNRHKIHIRCNEVHAIGDQHWLRQPSIKIKAKPLSVTLTSKGLTPIQSW